MFNQPRTETARMPGSLATGVARDRYRICQAVVPVIAVFQIEDLDLVARLAMSMLVANAESAASLSRKMTVKSEIWETGNVEVHYHLFLNKIVKQVPEKVVVQERMMVHE